jgi:uncharacterized protein
MMRWKIVVPALLVAGVLAAGVVTAGKPEAPRAYPETKWQALVPPDWDPLKKYRDPKMQQLDDGNVKQLQLMREMRAMWDEAPLVMAIDGQDVKIPGYVVPLEEGRKGSKEFLLVPYFGACIHMPPPPANQIIHVIVTDPKRKLDAMETVWVSGRIHAFRNDSFMGVAGYKLDAVAVDKYDGPPRY